MFWTRANIICKYFFALTSIKYLPKLSGFIVFFHTRIVLSADPVTRYSKLQSTAQTECTWPSIVCSRSILYAFECPSVVSILHILTFLSLDEVKSTTGQNLHFELFEDIFSFLRNFTHVINLSCASLTCARISPV